MRLRIRIILIISVLAALIFSVSQYVELEYLTGMAKPVPFFTANSFTHVVANSSSELEKLFEQQNYLWPLDKQQPIPPLLIQTLPADFPKIKSIQRKKALFLRTLLPMALLENQKLKNQREIILQMYMDKKLQPVPDSLVRSALDRLTKRYRLERDIAMKESLERLLVRLDEIPLSLVLAQGVIESGWGTSRFAVEGNSLFGEWTYNPAQGIAPKNRDKNAKHFVRAFPNILSSVQSYMNILNTRKAFKDFRIARAEMRRKQLPLASLQLAKGLQNYSAKGQSYVHYVTKVIRVNGLQELDSLPLATQRN